MNKSNALFLFLGLFLGAGLTSSGSMVQFDRVGDSLNNISKSNADSISEGEKVSLREIKQNPVKYEGEIVTVEGGSNSFADFIKDGGYQLPLDCSSYPDFQYASQFSVEVVVELENSGEGGPKLRCVDAPKAIGAYK